ncbi:MAG: acetyl-CoA carboxylase biotin carboxyl carrier protein [Tagaea sp.]
MASKKSKPAPKAAAPKAAASNSKAKDAPGFGPASADIERLAKLLEKTGLAELEYQEGTKRLRLSRGHSGGFAPLAMPAMTQAAAPATAAAPAAAAADAVPDDAVTSPMVGTAYLSPEPGAPAFVRVGDKVKEGQTLLIVEAMKVMNPIRSPRSGTVGRIIVQNGAPVEYGEALIVLE